MLYSLSFQLYFVANAQAKPLQRYRDLLALQVPATLNAALCRRHLTRCPQTSRLQKECEYVSGTATRTLRMPCEVATAREAYECNWFCSCVHALLLALLLVRGYTAAPQLKGSCHVARWRPGSARLMQPCRRLKMQATAELKPFVGT